jgi:HEAT repeat protein
MDKLDSLLLELTCGDDDRAEAAAMELGGYGEGALCPLERLSSGDDPAGRWWATRALAEFPSKQSAPHLIRVLQDTDASVRQCAAQALYQQPHASAIPALIHALLDSDSLVARLSGNALISIGSPAVLPLIDALKHGPTIQQIETARALSLIGDLRAIPALFEALDNDSSLIEYWANEGLERMGVGMVFFQP